MSELEIRKGAIDPSACLTEGWELIKPRYAMFFAMTITMVIITFLLGLLPYAGGILNAIVAGPFMCGIYYALIVKMRGEEVQFPMMFEGFSRILPAFLVTLIYSAPMLLLGAAAFFFVALKPETADITSGGDLTSILGRQLTAAFVVSAVAAYLISLVLQILLFFALPLIAEHDLGIGEAVKLSFAGTSANIGGLIVLFILEFLVMLVGLLGFCIGIFFVLPIVYAANVVAYRSVFPSRESTFFNEPPRPDAYSGDFGTIR